MNETRKDRQKNKKAGPRCKKCPIETLSYPEMSVTRNQVVEEVRIK